MQDCLMQQWPDHGAHLVGLFWVQLGASPPVVPCALAVGADLGAGRHAGADTGPVLCIVHSLHGL